MKKYVIGLDLGINNFVWSILNAEDKTLEKAGVRCLLILNLQRIEEMLEVFKEEKREDVQELTICFFYLRVLIFHIIIL